MIVTGVCFEAQVHGTCWCVFRVFVVSCGRVWTSSSDYLERSTIRYSSIPSENCFIPSITSCTSSHAVSVLSLVIIAVVLVVIAKMQMLFCVE